MSPSIWNLRRLGVRLLLSSALSVPCGRQAAQSAIAPSFAGHPGSGISPSQRMIGTGLDGFGTLRRSVRAVQRLLEVLLALLGQ
jgi:hypothetical protein